MGETWFPPRLRSRTALPSRDPRRCGSRSAPRSPAGRRQELDSAQPLGALPEVLARDDEAERAAVLGRERLAVGVRGEQGEWVLEERERRVRRVALLGVGDREVGASAWLGELGKRAPRDALERHVEAAPARDAVDVLGHLDLRQLVELLPREREPARPRPRRGSPRSRGRSPGRSRRGAPATCR